MSWADFDRYVEENNIAPEDLGEAFAQWLANETGEAVIGGPVGEPPLVVAVPDEPPPSRFLGRPAKEFF